MGKILGSWSGMRKYLEKDMLASSLQGRIRYGCTTYANMDACYIFEIYIDGKTVKQFSWETVNTYFVNQGHTKFKRLISISEYWEDFWKNLQLIPMSSRTEYTDEEFCEALKSYRNQPIQDSLSSDNPMERMFAVLDRRVGKRTLNKLKEVVTVQPEWLAQIYTLRLNAE